MNNCYLYFSVDIVVVCEDVVEAVGGRDDDHGVAADDGGTTPIPRVVPAQTRKLWVPSQLFISKAVKKYITREIKPVNILLF